MLKDGVTTVKTGVSRVSKTLRLEEFKKFAMKGNVVDLAVGVIIGAAFGKIVTSVVNDIIMPPLNGLFLGKSDFKSKFVALDGNTYETLKAAQEAGAPYIAYGAFLQNIFDFLIIAFTIFMLVRQLNRLKGEAPQQPPEATTKACPQCLSNIPIKATRCAQCTQPV